LVDACVIADPVLSDAGSAINAFSLLPGAPYDDNRSMPLWSNSLEKLSARLSRALCWCRDASISVPAAERLIPASVQQTFTVTGRPATIQVSADSGTKCTGILFVVRDAALQRGRGASHLIFVRVGTFDDPNLATPAMTIWTSSAPRWACIDTELPQVVKTAAAGGVMSDA